MKTIGTIIIISLYLGLNIFAQLETSSNTGQDKGKFIINTFSNFHSSVNQHESESAFEITRVYFGYSYAINDLFSTTVKLDIGSPNDESQYSLLKRYAYFKTAALCYHKDKLTWNFGLIDLLHFKLHDKFWGHRYVFKTFSDKNKFGSSADIGTNLIYNVTDNLSFDVSVINGEGYTKLQADDTYKGAAGVTYVYKKMITSRIYVDYTEKDIAQTTLSGFVGLKRKKITLGLEYNEQLYCNYEKDHNKFGTSLYGSFDFSEHWQIFARYDNLQSNTIPGDENTWNILNDGQTIISGVQYSPVKNIKIAANYQHWLPVSSENNVQQYVFINLEYKIN